MIKGLAKLVTLIGIIAAFGLTLGLSAGQVLAQTEFPSFSGQGSSPEPSEEGLVVVEPEADTDQSAGLQDVSLENVAVTAIIVSSDPANSTALLEVGGVGHLIHQGSRLGANSGFVKEITPTTVVIEESVEGTSRLVELTLDNF
jgi:Tfp pilus assembly protein PilP